MLELVVKWLAAQFAGPPSSRTNAVLIILFAIVGYVLFTNNVSVIKSNTELHTRQIADLAETARNGTSEAESRYLGLLATIGKLESSLESIKTDIHWLARGQREPDMPPEHPR